MLKRVSLLGVIVGGVVDVASTNIFAIPLLLYIIARLDPAYITVDRFPAAMTDSIHGSVVLFAVSWLPGIAGSVLGGYIAARIAKRDELLNGALSAYLCIALGVFTLIAIKARIPLYQVPLYEYMGFIVSPALGLLGGWLRLRQTRLASAPPQAA